MFKKNLKSFLLGTMVHVREKKILINFGFTSVYVVADINLSSNSQAKYLETQQQRVNKS